MRWRNRGGPDTPEAATDSGRTRLADLRDRMHDLPVGHPSSPHYGDGDAHRPSDTKPGREDLNPAESAWRQAVRQFAADWQRHLDRWPRPEQNSERRKLGPAVERQLALGCEKIQVAEREITSRLRDIEADQPDRALTGLEHRLKSQERTKEKAAEYLREMPDFTPAQALAMVPDPVRYTFVYHAESYSAGVVSDIKSLRAAGFEMLRLKNYWHNTEYKGINSQWREQQTGQRFEVQFHTSVSFEAKQLTHGAYERLREPPTLNSRRELTELHKLQRDFTAKVPVPPGASSIRDQT